MKIVAIVHLELEVPDDTDLSTVDVEVHDDQVVISVGDRRTAHSCYLQNSVCMAVFRAPEPASPAGA